MIEVTGVKESIRDLTVFSEKLGPRAESALFQAARFVTDHMKRRFLTNGPIHVRTGRLRSGWTPISFSDASSVGVVVGTRVKYARVHNYGFSGPVFVKQHTRRVRAGTRARRQPRSQKGRLRSRNEARLVRAERGRLEQQARAAHGQSFAQVRGAARTARRARGLQGGIEPLTGAARSGHGIAIVRAHGRFMRLRGHLYVERSLRDTRDDVLRILRHATRIPSQSGDI